MALNPTNDNNPSQGFTPSLGRASRRLRVSDDRRVDDSITMPAKRDKGKFVSIQHDDAEMYRNLLSMPRIDSSPFPTHGGHALNPSLDQGAEYDEGDRRSKDH